MRNDFAQSTGPVSTVCCTVGSNFAAKLRESEQSHANGF